MQCSIGVYLYIDMYRDIGVHMYVYIHTYIHTYIHIAVMCCSTPSKRTPVSEDYRAGQLESPCCMDSPLNFFPMKGLP